MRICISLNFWSKNSENKIALDLLIYSILHQKKIVLTCLCGRILQNVIYYTKLCLKKPNISAKIVYMWQSSQFSLVTKLGKPISENAANKN